MKKPTMKSNLDGLRALYENVSAMGKGRVQLGIFGNKTARGQGKKVKGKYATYSTAAESNADIGAKNEYGSFSEGIPARSWLRMPLAQYGELLVGHAKASMGGVELAKRTPKLLLQRLGLAAESLIHYAFKTSGWGQWQPNSAYTIRMKGSDKPLIDTAQLERGVSSRVVMG
jgi:hypothetical protein